MAKQILTKEQETQFKEWMEDGNVSKIDDNTYLEQTTQWRKEFTLDELKAFFKREYLSDSYYRNGGSVSEYKIYEGYDHYKSIPIYQVQGVGENEYVGEWHKDIKDAEKELFELINKSKFSGGGNVKSIHDFTVIGYNDNLRATYFVDRVKNNATFVPQKEFGYRIVRHTGSVLMPFGTEFTDNWQRWFFMNIDQFEVLYSNGGSIEAQNYAMAQNDNKAIMHHSNELNNILKTKKKIPAWALALINQSSQNLSNVTHYLDGAETFATGGVSKKIYGDNVTFLDAIGNEQVGMVQDMDDKGVEVFYEERFMKVPTHKIVKFH